MTVFRNTHWYNHERCLPKNLVVGLGEPKKYEPQIITPYYRYFLCQAREKFGSLKKTTWDEVVAELEEDLHNSKSALERRRFNLVNALVNIEAKKKFEFLESFSAVMDSHLRYFRLGYDVLNQIEPFYSPVRLLMRLLSLALVLLGSIESKCLSPDAQCDTGLCESTLVVSDLGIMFYRLRPLHSCNHAECNHLVLTYAQQSKEQANIEQDKLAKRIQEFRTQSELNQLQASDRLATSSNPIGMNGIGIGAYKNMDPIMLTTSKGEVQTIKQGYLLKRSSSLRADWKRRFFILDSQGTLYYYRNKGTKAGGSSSFHTSHSLEHNNHVFESLGCSTVDLRTSTIKIDAEDTDLRLCFRIISPLKTYTLQAETEADRIDWMNKITGVIVSILNSHLQQLDLWKIDNDKVGPSFSRPLDYKGNTPDDMRINQADSVSRILREVPGNDQCAECSASAPDWASLNLGILMCIECSGIHRNLGVHISKVRSVTLDVKVWEPTVLELFQALGNAYCNSIWEELLPLHKDLNIESEAPSVTKPSLKDAIHQKEKYIQAKYVRKLLVNKEVTAARPGNLSSSIIWEAVRGNNLRVNIINSTYDDMPGCNLYNDERGSQQSFHDSGKKHSNPSTRGRVNSSGNPLEGCSLLHLACHSGSLVMLELLLQLGADINKCDLNGRTPLQHCILEGNNEMAKFLLKRGAWASIKDSGGFTALERAMEMGAITDEEFFILLSEREGELTVYISKYI
ncbi:hypothetical protein CDL12_26095 [Handroanthus impetiginosus]|uniref:GTPase-activating protein n=1 Tax=Handroanthus impetiginosus TaxID=429701 RepID=A0A2G9G7X7_9LAMI|nr:hypothetical protein CDL12_26095 [Handroanthus impetiginosus]